MSEKVRGGTERRLAEGPDPGLSEPGQSPAWLLHSCTRHAAFLDNAAQAILSTSVSVLVLSEWMNVPRRWKKYKSNFLFVGHNGEFTRSIGDATKRRVRSIGRSPYYDQSSLPIR